MILVDGQRVPLRVHLSSASTDEVALAETTLARVSVPMADAAGRALSPSASWRIAATSADRSGTGFAAGVWTSSSPLAAPSAATTSMAASSAGADGGGSSNAPTRGCSTFDGSLDATITSWSTTWPSSIPPVP